MGNSLKNCGDLEVWQKGVALVNEFHEATNGFPGEGKLGPNQIRRAAVRLGGVVGENRDAGPLLDEATGS